jgi:signal transduction histidine kinase
MIEMLNETLSMSKADAGKVNFAPDTFEVVSFCKVIMEELSVINTDSHTLTFACESQHIYINQDSKLLAIVVTNLISNAIKYSPNGGEVKISIKERPGGIIVTVSDQGIGIDEKDLREIFQPFFRGKNIGNIKGTGLGLSIVKKYIEIIGGTIDFQSELGKGSSVIDDIPSIN